MNGTLAGLREQHTPKTLRHSVHLVQLFSRLGLPAESTLQRLNVKCTLDRNHSDLVFKNHHVNKQVDNKQTRTVYSKRIVRLAVQKTSKKLEACLDLLMFCPLPLVVIQQNVAPSAVDLSLALIPLSSCTFTGTDTQLDMFCL